MTVVGVQPQLGRGAGAGEPPAVRAGHDLVLDPVHKQDRRAQLGGVEPPRGDVGQVVVDQRGREQGLGGAPMFGVPWCQNTARRASRSPAPVSYTWIVRPSASPRSLSVTICCSCTSFIGLALSPGRPSGRRHCHGPDLPFLRSLHHHREIFLMSRQRRGISQRSPSGGPALRSVIPGR